MSTKNSKTRTLETRNPFAQETFAAQLTEVPGSSAAFRGGAVAYSNALKESLLGVPPGVLARSGAVSEECARAMAALGAPVEGWPNSMWMIERPSDFSW